MADPEYRLARALLSDGKTERFVIIDGEDCLHGAATAWLGFLYGSERSPNTVEAYGRRVAYYLSWTVRTADWCSVSLSHLAMWRRTVANTPVRRKGSDVPRKHSTVSVWMTPVRSFYEWADAERLLTTDIAQRITEVKYFAPGSPGGGEHGAFRRVLADELKPAGQPVAPDPEWIDDAEARAALEELTLNFRDRFLVDLMYYTGIRIGEALSLFKADMHFGGGSPSLGCRYADPHFHVRLDNPVENKARSKGGPRALYVAEHLVDRYVDYMLERERILGDADRSPHAFVNLYCPSPHLGKAMKYGNARDLLERCGERIGFPLTGPHVLRHTFATRLVRGIDCEAQPLDVVQALLGHRSLNSTRIYTHDLEAAKKAALTSIAPRRLVLGQQS